jgi:hypothetical protein
MRPTDCPTCSWLKGEKRINVATLDGSRHYIPEMSLMGYCHGGRRSVLQAIEWWAYQCELSAR